MTVKVIVATHKKYDMPSDEIYLPVHVGAAGKDSIGFQRDDEGDNISALNPYYCELTGIYWAWKNLKEDYIGLVHYRRIFEIKGHPITKQDIEPYLGNIKVFIPKKRHYYIESLKSHYNHTHYPEHLYVLKQTLMEKYPEYEESYDKAIKRTWGYMFNMMILERSLLNNYCVWLFDILDDVFKRIDTSEYQPFAKRYIGRLSELLFNVWLEQQMKCGVIKKNEIKELKCNVEENWFVKIPAFFKAKFFGEKYKGSF